jgi:hypothetical protein
MTMQRYLLTVGLLLLCASSASAFNNATFDDCTITARRSQGSTVTKWYTCGAGYVTSGTTISVSGFRGDNKEFGDFYDGETDNFGTAPTKVSAAFTDCTFNGKGCGNCDGYMSESAGLDCAQGTILLKGRWGDEYQGHWEYHLRFGEVDTAPQWVDDPQKDIDFTSTFQKWCPTKFGFTLCGWIDEPTVDHGEPPAFKR